MRRWWPLVVLGVLAFVTFALATLPARFVLSQFASAGVHGAGVSGTVWKGRAQVLIVDGVRIGAVEWDLHFLPLLTARLTADANVTRSDGFVQTEVTVSPAGRLSFADLTASLPFSALPPNTIPGGWIGTLNLRLAALTIEDNWPVSAQGVIEILNVTGPARKPVNMGSYKVDFPEDAPVEDALTGALSDLGGPLQIAGTVQLKAPERSYLINGMIATRPDAPPDVANALQYLGPPDEQGRRPFTLEGTM